MPPNSEEPYIGSIGFRRPVTGLSVSNIGGDLWLDGRRQDDGAEGLWRVHDDLYDLANFIKRHPGGAQWLELTRGTDITEAFETHHIRGVADQLLPKFLVKRAETPRSSPFTFAEDGFYRTLKRRLGPLLKNLPKTGERRSAIYTDLLLLSTFMVSIFACRFWSYLLGAAAGVLLSCLTIAAHNYSHQKDNIRMYYFNISLMSYREWRITHALSHHLFTNTIIDLEMLGLQPFCEYFPKEKGLVVKYLSWVYFPIFWIFYFHFTLIGRIKNYLIAFDRRIFVTADLVPYILPLMMYAFGGQTLMATIGFWTFIINCGSFHFVFVGINAAHHHPDIFHDGDTPRQEKDWGIAQLDAVMDRHEITGSHYLVLTNFGDHALHHMFPTVDHGLLDHMYPVFNETMKDFNIALRMTSQAELIKGNFLQLSRSKPNPNPPDLLKYKSN